MSSQFQDVQKLVEQFVSLVNQGDHQKATLIAFQIKQYKPQIKFELQKKSQQSKFTLTDQNESLQSGDMEMNQPRNQNYQIQEQSIKVNQQLMPKPPLKPISLLFKDNRLNEQYPFSQEFIKQIQQENQQTTSVQSIFQMLKNQFQDKNENVQNNQEEQSFQFPFQNQNLSENQTSQTQNLQKHDIQYQESYQQTSFKDNSSQQDMGQEQIQQDKQIEQNENLNQIKPAQEYNQSLISSQLLKQEIIDKELTRELSVEIQQNKQEEQQQTTSERDEIISTQTEHLKENQVLQNNIQVSSSILSEENLNLYNSQNIPQIEEKNQQDSQQQSVDSQKFTLEQVRAGLQEKNMLYNEQSLQEQYKRYLSGEIRTLEELLNLNELKQNQFK